MGRIKKSPELTSYDTSTIVRLEGIYKGRQTSDMYGTKTCFKDSFTGEADYSDGEGGPNLCHSRKRREDRRSQDEGRSGKCRKSQCGTIFVAVYVQLPQRIIPEFLLTSYLHLPSPRRSAVLECRPASAVSA